MIVEHAPAKLNLALHVRARRADGYHELETLFAFVDHGDTVSLERAERTTLTITGPFAAGLDTAADNLVLVAAAAFRATFQTKAGYAITLDKQLPVASGIGGGSADAAATLRALARLHGVAEDSHLLRQVAASIGSDVPACLLGRTAVGRGRGERLEIVEGLAGAPVLLVNPGVGVSTAQVFARWDGLDRGPLPIGAAAVIVSEGRNDLETPAVAAAPEIADVLHLLRAQTGVRLARMSGSGATCFALCDDALAQAVTASAIRTARPSWWVAESVLRP